MKVKSSSRNAVQPVGEEKMVVLCSSRRRSPPKERCTFSKSASSSGTECTSCLRGRSTIGKAKDFMKRVRKIIKKKRTLSTSESDVHRDFDDALDPYILAGVRQNAEKGLIQPWDEK